MNLVHVIQDFVTVLFSWNIFIPVSVWSFMAVGILLTVVLVILKRANK